MTIQGNQDNLLTSESLFLPLLLQGGEVTIYILSSLFSFFRSLSNAPWKREEYKPVNDSTVLAHLSHLQSLHILQLQQMKPVFPFPF